MVSLRDICFQQDIDNIVFITMVTRGRLHETTCFHTTVRIYPAKSGTGYILYIENVVFNMIVSQVRSHIKKMLNNSQK